MTPDSDLPIARPSAGPRRLRPAKRDAIERAARTVFARDGYSRASIDAIAQEAGVSTRTIYNHFADKEALFGAVLVAGAATVAATFEQSVESGLSDANADADVLVLARAIAAHRLSFPEHFRMVYRLGAESHHFPDALIDAWQEAGPRPVHRSITDRLRRLGDLGLLSVADPEQAARHLVALTMAEIITQPSAADTTLTDEQIAAAARAFVHGYR